MPKAYWMPSPDDALLFERLFDQHYDDVFRFAQRRADDDSAREIAAETFVVAWRRRDDLPDRAMPWLYGIARNVLLASYRRSRRIHKLDGRGHELDGQVDRPEPDHAAQVADADWLAALLEQLPDQDREAFMLIGWEDLSIGEAARVIGCTANALRVRLHRARKRVQCLMTDQHEAATDHPPSHETRVHPEVRP